MTDQHPIIGPEGLADDQAVSRQISAVEKLSDQKIDALRQVTEKDTAYLNRVYEERWSAHNRVHEQEHEALRLALVNLEKRLDALNELRALVGDRDRQFVTIPALTALAQSLDEFKADTRRRFEAMDVLLRAEARPGQDLKSNWAAIVAFIGLLAVLVGIYLGLR